MNMSNACNCTLPYTNPHACQLCPNKPTDFWRYQPKMPPADNILQLTKQGRNQLKRVRDIYGQDGKLKQRIWEYQKGRPTFPFISTTSPVDLHWHGSTRNPIKVTY